MLRLFDTKVRSQCLAMSSGSSGMSPPIETFAPLQWLLVFVGWIVWVQYVRLTRRNIDLRDIVRLIIIFGGYEIALPFPVKTVIKISSFSAISLIYLAST